MRLLDRFGGYVFDVLDHIDDRRQGIGHIVGVGFTGEHVIAEAPECDGQVAEELLGSGLSASELLRPLPGSVQHPQHFNTAPTHPIRHDVGGTAHH